ncbi:hypothetical protein AB0C02_30545 [Micromonospora sp. NPDC048999]|uniref:hypothetical protein n=1 Tax=Micromonospora sp. NPDC048999 TaxID=3155391 RepID=UPI003407F008
MLDGLDVQDGITVLLAVTVLALGGALFYVTRPEEGEATQEMSVVEGDPVWRAFYATAPRWRRWLKLSRRPR